jgi:two-component sensor histidine kinase
VVSSLLSIQGREISDQKALEAVNESKNRVHSMALIHQYLYSENDLKSIDMQQYISQLCKRLFSAYKLDHDLVDLRIEVDPIHVDVDTAVPMGIVINELITNALKYAFPDNREGFLEVRLHEDGGKLHLKVSDNGVGKSAEAREGFSFGSKLIEAFRKKLDAELEITHQNGYQVHYKIGRYKLWEQNIAS